MNKLDKNNIESSNKSLVNSNSDLLKIFDEDFSKEYLNFLSRNVEKKLELYLNGFNNLKSTIKEFVTISLYSKAIVSLNDDILNSEIISSIFKMINLDKYSSIKDELLSLLLSLVKKEDYIVLKEYLLENEILFFVIDLRNIEKLGTAKLIITSSNKGKYGILEQVEIDKEIQGKGLGSKLVSNIISFGKENNLYKIVGTSSKWDKGLNNFYEKLGFRKYSVGFRLDLSNYKAKS